MKQRTIKRAYRECQTERGRQKFKKNKAVRLTKVDGLPTDRTVAYHDSIKLFINVRVCACALFSPRGATKALV